MDTPAENIKIETDEDGFYLVVETRLRKFSFHLLDPEDLYDKVKAEIGPWLYERDMAKATYPGNVVTFPDGDAYDADDPKHPDYHSIRSEIFDQDDGA